jgi:hypothetical protein
MSTFSSSVTSVIGTPVALVAIRMHVRLKRKLAEKIDGIDLSNQKVGDVFDLPDGKARMLVAEGWAVLERRSHDGRHLVLAFRRSDDPGPLSSQHDADLSRAS